MECRWTQPANWLGSGAYLHDRRRMLGAWLERCARTRLENNFDADERARLEEFMNTLPVEAEVERGAGE